MRSSWHFWFCKASEGTSTCQRNYPATPYRHGARARMGSKGDKGPSYATRGQVLLAFFLS